MASTTGKASKRGRTARATRASTGTGRNMGKAFTRDRTERASKASGAGGVSRGGKRSEPHHAGIGHPWTVEPRATLACLPVRVRGGGRLGAVTARYCGRGGRRDGGGDSNRAVSRLRRVGQRGGNGVHVPGVRRDGARTCPGGRRRGDGPYGETMREKRARWVAEGRCRNCGVPGPHRKPDGTLSKNCARCRKHGSRAPGGGRHRGDVG